MIEKVKGISIHGRCFKNNTQLSLYPKFSDRIAIVYGRNGSGKSTISNAISSISSDEISDDISAELIDEKGNSVGLSQDCSIHVFNEQYIDQNVKIDDDGLGTIILLGGQVDLQTEIDNCIKKKDDALVRRDAAQASVDRFEDNHNPQSPKFQYAAIKKILHNGWAANDCNIRGNKISSKVTPEIIQEICELSVSETAPQLQKKFDEAKQLLAKVSDTTIEYPVPIAKIEITEEFEENFCALLYKQIEKPILTDREKQILAVIENGRQATIEQAKEDFSKPDTLICPYCFQSVDDHYKHGLIDSINRVLNKDVDKHKLELQNIEFPDLSTDYVAYSKLDTELVTQIVEQQKNCRKLVDDYKKLSQKKYENIYTPINVESLGLEKAIGILNSLLEQLEDARKTFVDAITRKKALVENLIRINKKLAHIQIESTYREYQRQKRSQTDAVENLKKVQKELDSFTEKLKELEQKKSNVGLAIKSINNALDYVFFSHSRLSIELKNNKYYLKSNGNDVKPKNISVGERNIIALCYFFTQILSNQDIQKLYQAEELIVIDDPVSSFDFENKIGISSLLRYQTFQIIQGNRNSKILLLTHDLSTLYDMQKIADELTKESKSIDKGNTVKSNCFELIGGELRLFYGSFNEYQELLKTIYKYAKGDTNGLDLTIGNIMRRSIEAFSTFMYGTGIAEISYNKNAMKSLGEHSAYFENLMYRLVLNSESHFEDRICGMQSDFHFYKFITPDEKKNTCKNILCFMYCLSPDHIRSHLSEAVIDIQKWIEDIPENEDFNLSQNLSFKVVRLYDFPLSAGHGNDIFDGEVAFEDYKTLNQECDFALRISGVSMDPKIKDNSIVLIKKVDTVQEGEIGAFYLNGEVFCKKLLYQNGKAFLESINTLYSPIEIHDEDMFSVYGKVIEVIN